MPGQFKNYLNAVNSTERLEHIFTQTTREENLNIAIRRSSLSASFPIPSAVLNTAGVKVPFSTFNTLGRYHCFFSSSWLLYIWGILFSQLALSWGLNTLTSINALANGDQRFLALMSSRAPGDVIEPLGSFSPVRGSRGGSTSTSLHTLSKSMLCPR